MKVAKFGGSSLADADQFKKVGNIVKADTDRKFIVVSAPGKRHDLDYKMTDLLINLAEAYINNDKYKSYYITIMDRFTKIIDRKSTRLNSSHVANSYAVCCLKNTKNDIIT